MDRLLEACLRLFKGVPIEKKVKRQSKYWLEKTIGFGFVLSPYVIANYKDCEKIVNLARKFIGISAEEVNKSFHKSWQKVKNANLEDLVVEQLTHYLTTYGKENPVEYIEEKSIQWGVDNLGAKIIGLRDFESNKIQDADYIYIPKEALEIPEFEGLNLAIIHGYTKKELKEKLLDLLETGIALNEDSIRDVIEVAIFVEVNGEDIEKIKNKEVRVALYDYLNLIPKEPVEFLRYIIYKVTDKTLLIKSKEVIEQIKENSKESLIKLFRRYDREAGYKRLAEIFYRFKPIFLALRTNTKMKQIINKIRRLAKKYHKPMLEDYLNIVTAKIKHNELNVERLKEELEKVNIFRKIRLAYALKFRTKEDVDSILYRIRNGKGYATSFKFDNKIQARRILNIVLDSIANDIKRNVKNKKIYIPDYISYSLPATEKQFSGYFPCGSYISIPESMIVGIYWNNLGNKRVDLDLSTIDEEGSKIGWDASFRKDGAKILFSGDVTNAKDGASELLYVKRQGKQSLIVFVNFYNSYEFEDNKEVPFKIIVAKERVVDFKQNYMVNPNNIVAVAETKIKKKTSQKVLGLLVTTFNENRFYFVETYLGRSITSWASEFVENTRKYLFNFYENSIKLKDILIRAGAKIVNKKERADIDLSVENLQKDTILSLIKQ